MAAVEPLAAAHHEDWKALYRGYADFYQAPMNDVILASAWQSIQDGKIFGIGAVVDSRLVGFAHWEVIARPLRGATLAYLHDLFTLPAARGQGIARLLISRVRADACAHGCPMVRWATRADNTRARGLYDKVATATDWVLYETDSAAEPSS